MMRDPNESLHKIEDVKRHLYDRDYSPVTGHREGMLHNVRHEVPDAWPQPPASKKMIKSHSPLLKNFFIGAVIFFIGAVIFGLMMFSKGPDVVTNDKIDITVLGNAFAQGGEELPLQIEIVNRNNAKLELVNMNIEYPRGASADENVDMIRLPRDPIGTIEAGGRVERNTKVTLYGDQGSVKNVKLKVEYHPEGSNATFTKEVLYPVTISSAPISLTIDGPTQTSANQEVEFTVKVSLNTTLPTETTLLKIDYPSGFIYESAVPAPIKNKSIWSLSTLSQTAPLTIQLKGRMVGQDGDEQALHVYVGTANPLDPSVIDVVYNSLLHTVALAKPFLQADLVYNQDSSSDSYAVKGGQLITMGINWANNLPTRVTDAEIRLHFSGNVFDKDAVFVNGGFYDSSTSEIIWNKTSSKDFSSIEPGGNGNVTFGFTPLSILGGSDAFKDPQIAMEVSIKGREPSAGTGFTEVRNINKKIIKIISNFQLAANVSHTDGPIPPQAEEETTYTVLWTLSNSPNAISGGEARTVLPIYVKWGGVVGTTAENVVFNDVTREVIWKIGNVKANTGFGSSNREISFKVILKPSTSQIGSVPQLVKETVLTGLDTFAKKDIKTLRNSMNTQLTGDPKFKSGDERVIK